MPSVIALAVVAVTMVTVTMVSVTFMARLFSRLVFLRHCRYFRKLALSRPIELHFPLDIAKFERYCYRSTPRQSIASLKRCCVLA